jgi:hypothetical protein
MSESQFWTAIAICAYAFIVLSVIVPMMILGIQKWARLSTERTEGDK